jgi:hypothetical protein
VIGWMRRHIAPLAAFLVLIVGAERLDLPGCSDEDPEGTVATSCTSSTSVPAPQDGPHDGGEDGLGADCLCHVVFVPAPAVPVVGAPAASLFTFGSLQKAVPSAAPAPLDHVPLA